MAAADSLWLAPFVRLRANSSNNDQTTLRTLVNMRELCPCFASRLSYRLVAGRSNVARLLDQEAVPAKMNGLSALHWACCVIQPQQKTH
jgi:hypothetical protein